jgi:hypothetical protein
MNPQWNLQGKRLAKLFSNFTLGLISFWVIDFFLANFAPALAQETEDGDGNGIVGFIISLVTYCFFAYCLQRILQKIDQPNPWMAWIPIVNLYAIFIAGDKPGWWLILVIIPLVNFIGVVLLVMAWINIMKKLGKSPWLLLLIIVPIVNILFMGYLAFA